MFVGSKVHLQLGMGCGNLRYIGLPIKNNITKMLKNQNSLQVSLRNIFFHNSQLKF